MYEAPPPPPELYNSFLEQIKPCLTELNSLQPSRDPIYDAKVVESRLNAGFLSHWIVDRKSAFRTLLALRETYSRYTTDPYKAIIDPKYVEVIDRFLSYHGIRSQTQDELEIEIPDTSHTELL